MPEGLTPDPARDPEVLPLPLRGSETPQPGRCCSPLANRPGRFCTSYPLRGKTRCRKHGGRSLSGFASATFKHGLYSKDLKGLLGKNYQQARQNPDLISNYEQVALFDALISECLGRLTSMDPRPDWDLVVSVHAAFHVFEGAQRLKDVASMMSSQTVMKSDLAALVEARGALQHYLETREQLAALIEQRRKLVDSEVKRRKDAQEMILKPQVYGLMSALLHIVVTEVTDRRQRQRILDGVRLLTEGTAK